MDYFSLIYKNIQDLRIYPKDTRLLGSDVITITKICQNCNGRTNVSSCNLSGKPDR